MLLKIDNDLILNIDDDGIHYGRRACAGREAKETPILLTCRKTSTCGGWSFNYLCAPKSDYLTTEPIQLFLSERCDTHKYRLYKFTFMNGTQVPRKVDHNTYLKVYPVANHVFEDEDQDIPAIRQCKEGLITNLPYCAHGEFNKIFK